MLNIDLDKSFSPKRRRLEHKLVRETQKAINNLDIPQEEKIIINNMWWNYLLKYERRYKKYHKMREAVLAILN